jgi:hypothetical protein
VDEVLVEGGRAIGVAVRDARSALSTFGAAAAGGGGGPGRGGARSGALGGVQGAARDGAPPLLRVRARMAVISDVGAANTFGKLLPRAVLDANPALAQQAAKASGRRARGVARACMRAANACMLRHAAVP